MRNSRPSGIAPRYQFTQIVALCRNDVRLKRLDLCPFPAGIVDGVLDCAVLRKPDRAFWVAGLKETPSMIRGGQTDRINALRRQGRNRGVNADIVQIPVAGRDRNIRHD